MKIFCISEGSIYRIDIGKPQQLTCGRIRDYLHAVNEMKKRDEWKTTGHGAQFMQVEQKYYETEGEFLRSLSSDGKRLIYGTFIDNVGGLYFKDPETDDETYIFANQTVIPGRVSCRNGKYCFDAGEGAYERHIAWLDPSNGGVDQLTEGFTDESCPFISRRDPDIVYYTAIGYAQNSTGAVVEKSPCSISMYNAKTGELTDVLSDEGYDYMKPSDDEQGNLYYIKRKYEPTRRKSNIGMDILMFPYRLVKAVGGFLSFFSMRYGGEPLRTGGNNPARSKTADERELFVEGNLIKAKRIADADNSEEGIIPSEWALIKRSPSGEETVLAKGVMDYLLLDSGVILYSDGRFVKRLSGGTSEKVCRIDLANCISVTE
ncbi:MAG: hypothetical protein J6O50_12415 [Ruminiclostridium sp.]|nr:hypothetical protein [Ruminiclostridium sp.]